MLEIFKVAIGMPSQIKTIIRKKNYMTIIFVLTILIISFIPITITAIVGKGLPPKMETYLFDVFYFGSSGPNELMIQNYELKNHDRFYFSFSYGDYNIATENAPGYSSVNKILVSFEKTGLRVSQVFMNKLYTYESLAIENFSFKSPTIEGTNVLSRAITRTLLSNSSINITFMILKKIFLYTAVYLLGAVLLMLSRNHRVISTSRAIEYKIALYSIATPFLLFTLLNLFNFNLFGIFAVVLLLFLAINMQKRAYEGILNEIMVDTLKKQNQDDNK